MTPNKGQIPAQARNKRVLVTLRNGLKPAENWAADGKNGCRWTLTGDDFDIMEWEIA